MKKYKYTILIERNANQPPHLNEDARHLGRLELNADFEGDPLCCTEHGITGYGAKVVVQTIVESVSNMALIMKDMGVKEGAVYRDAIEMLKKELVSLNKKKPQTNTVPRKPHDLDGKGWGRKRR